MDKGTFLYLAKEDAEFAQGWGLTEEEFIKFFGSLAEYKLLELQRKEGRELGFDVPTLPATIGAEQLKSMRRLGLTEKQVAPLLVGDHRRQIDGIQSTIEMDKKMGGAVAAARRELKEGKPAGTVIGPLVEVKGGTPPAGPVQLTDAERVIAKRMGVSEEVLLKDKGR